MQSLSSGNQIEQLVILKTGKSRKKTFILPFLYNPYFSVTQELTRGSLFFWKFTS